MGVMGSQPILSSKQGTVAVSGSRTMTSSACEYLPQCVFVIAIELGLGLGFRVRVRG